MQQSRISAGIALAVAAAGCAALGVLTAPVGIPLVEGALSGSAPDLSHIPHALASGNVPQALLAYLRALPANPREMTALSVWTLGILAAAVAYALWLRLKSPGRDVSRGVLGDARIVERPSELRRRNDFWNGRGTPACGSLVLGSSRRGYLYDSSIPHWAVVGKTGSGKSQLMVLQTLHLLMACGWNLIVTGKEELLELTGGKAVELGYRRVVFDLKGYPGASRFNPLGLVVEYAEAGDVDLAQRAARQLAADLVPMEGESNPYFPRAARSALSACALIVAMADIPREQKNMASVCSLVNLGTTGEGADPSAPLKGYIRGDAVGPDHPAYGPAADFLSDGGTTTAGKNVLSTLKEALSIFNDEGVARITAASDVPIRQAVREKTVVYMHLLEEGDPYLNIMTVFLNQWWRVAQEEAAGNGGRLPIETAIVGDEWGNLPAVSAMPEIVTLGRSYHIRVQCFTQDYNQWLKYSKPGDKGAGRDKILGSMGGKVALSLANPEDFDYFTKLAGKRTVRTRSTGTSRQGAGMAARGGSSESFSERSDDLIHPWEWQNRVPIRDGIIAVKGGENSRPGREGVFCMPVAYASETPAGDFFGLGDEEECREKRMRFRAEMAARDMPREKVPAWHPDFETGGTAATGQTGIEADEWGAWD